MTRIENLSIGISKPGQGRNLILPSEAQGRDPKFFAERPSDVNWTLRVRHLDGHVVEMPHGTDWEVTSRFGAVRSAVITHPDGSPAFDRPRYDEAPNVNIVAYGKDHHGKIHVAMISQARPHADNVFEPDSTEDMRFAQIPMGFLDKVVGKDQLESVASGATRETAEETGAVAVKSIAYPEYPQHYPNPTMIGTTSNLAFVEVDLNKIGELKVDRDEGIFQADYIPLDQLLRDIKAGRNEHGYTRMATTNSALLIFLSNLESIQHAERNARHVSAQSAANREFKATDPEGYVRHAIRMAIALHGDKAEDPVKYRKGLELKGQIYLDRRKRS
jgi:hypothetical protein